MEGFKVGITYKPFERWRGSTAGSAGYAHEGWREFKILCVHGDSELISHMEKKCLLKYRRYDRQGCLINNDGDYLNLNRAPGGEGAHHGIPPHLLYRAVR